MRTLDGVEPPPVFGHPRGLIVLAATEFWERVSFHGMQALLVLYMVEQLLLPGHVENIAGFVEFRATIEAVTGPLSTQALASQIFGLYVGLAALTPVLGGALGDRVLGRTRAVASGALLMTAGHLCMAFDGSFLLALLLLILGTGCLRGNLAPQVGDLYERDDRRRGVAFQIYGSMINLGAFIAPVVTGALSKTYGWHAGFGFAAIGMSLGLVVYLAGQRDLRPALRGAPKATRVRLRNSERRVVLLLLLLTPLAATFWIAQSQIWNTYNLWVRDHVDLLVGGFRVPVPWLQSLDGLAPLVTLPTMLLFWRRQAARQSEPDVFVKLALGCFIFAASTFWLAAGQFVTDATGRTPLIWAVVFHFVSNVGWLYFAPTLLELLSRAAPTAINATLVGLYPVSSALGSIASGRLGGLYETLSPAQFWTLHALIVGAGGVLILIYAARARCLLISQ